MINDINRRRFIQGAAAAGLITSRAIAQNEPAAPAAATPTPDPGPPPPLVRVGIAGLFGRGKSHVEEYSKMRGVEIVALCDVDERVLSSTARQIDMKSGKSVKQYKDIRKMLEDKDIDAVSFATPNHWHALGTIWACQAGKDVYCEKPQSHGVFEGRQAVKAARKYNRIVQVGTQSRSSAALQEAVKKMREGAIGEVYMARGLCFKWRPAIGKAAPSDPPEGFDYDIWTGPADMQPYTRNRHPYKWHWMWNTGNGDLGNQGVHEMDKCRWGLGVDLPTHVVAGGDKFMFDDDQETPNTMSTVLKYPDLKKMVVFEVRHWITNTEGGMGSPGDNSVGNIFYGSEGYLVMPDYNSYQIYKGRKQEAEPPVSKGGNHFQNFIDCVRSRKQEDLNCEVEEGHKSAAMVHLANIAHITGRGLNFDPKTEQIIGDPEANAMLKRAGRAPFIIPEEV